MTSGFTHGRIALVGLILALPGIVLVTGGLAQSILGAGAFNDAINYDLFIFHPAIILGGLVMAAIVNLIPLIRLRIEESALVGIFQISGRLSNLAIVTMVCLLGVLIFVYLLAENLQIFAD